MLEKGKKYECNIVDMGQNGVGIGKHDGFTVFVDGALLGETVDVKITKSKKKYAEGVISKVKENLLIGLRGSVILSIASVVVARFRSWIIKSSWS